jgi:hypothetical protein
LQVVTNSWNVCGNFKPRCQTYSRNLTECRVWLLGSSCVNPRANASTLRTALQSWRFCLLLCLLAFVANKLLDSGHGMALTLKFCLLTDLCFATVYNYSDSNDFLSICLAHVLIPKSQGGFGQVKLKEAKSEYVLRVVPDY